MIIPYLREDLEILRGNSREDGSPAWLLYDALRNKYFTKTKKCSKKELVTLFNS